MVKGLVRIVQTIMTLLIVVSWLNGQVLYSKQGLQNNYFSGITEEISGNFLFVNHNETQSANGFEVREQLIRLSPFGQVIDTLNLEDNFSCLKPPVYFQGNYLFFGTLFQSSSSTVSAMPLLLKYDQNFNLVERKELFSNSSSNVYATKMLTAPGNFYFAINLDGNPKKSIIYTTDFLFNILDSSLIDGNIQDIIVHNNHLVASGFFFSANSGGYCQTAELDSSLQILNVLTLNNLSYIPECGIQVGIMGSTTLVDIDELKYLVTGSGVVTNTNCSTGFRKNISAIIHNTASIFSSNLIGLENVDNMNFLPGLFTSKYLKQVYSVSYVIRSYIPAPDPRNVTTKIAIAKMDTSGALQWLKHYGEDKYYLPISIFATSDGGAILTGLRYDTVNPVVANVGEGFVMKIDKSGNEIFVGLIDKNAPNIKFHKCFPNPALDEIKFELPLEKSATISIYNELGIEIDIFLDYHSRSSISTVHLSSGLYTYKIKTKSSVYSGKFVKE
ncbi:hypothetical protein CNR22_13295 [Sphingobacteriaceae bacterium]|nr:hypothetical protein CNR22_13295 [Sphingobacteriaceae bacterium]